ncbi:hypothetical protein [Pseudomonas nitroreducens]|uniref:hypothetical protein n=1 Tax=Pseudomonas nitroreducens TaxID=46680 RepID=UPI0018763388|nr:hypothetical protein [Pseudomonas nitritireducens]
MLLDTQSINPIGTPIEVIRARLESLPRFPRYADQVDAVLALLGSIRPWLSGEAGPALASAAYDHNDAIFQLIDGYSERVLPNKLRQFSKVPSATDMETIMAFALGCGLRALGALASVLEVDQEDELSSLEMFSLHLETIAECLPAAAVSLDVPENALQACEELGESARDGAKQATAKADGIRGGFARRGRDGSGPRDAAIRAKALELIRSGTRLHNLNSKLRAWQKRETGQAISKPAMGAILCRLGLGLND